MNDSLSKETILDRLDRQARELRDVPAHATVPFYMKPQDATALIESVKCLKEFLHDFGSTNELSMNARAMLRRLEQI